MKATRISIYVLVIVALGLSCTTGVSKNPKAPDSGASQTFQTTHVTLYDCGLAQLEQRARVSGAAELEIKVQQAHLDDLMASLILAGDEGVKVKGVRYDSMENLGQAVAASGMANTIAAMTEEDQFPTTLVDYTKTLIGTQVTVSSSSKGDVFGTVLDCVEPGETIRSSDQSEESTKGGQKKDYKLVLVSSEGSLVWLSLEDVKSITPVSKREAAAIENFAGKLGKANGFIETGVTISTTDDSSGRLAAGYIRQSPLWRSIYKISIDKKGLLIEAWALVHNDTTDDWNDVQMTLISGLPTSYVMSLASPRYAEREELELNTDSLMMPQLGAHTPDSFLYDFELESAFVTIGHGGGSGSGSGYGRGAGMMSGRRSRSPRVRSASVQTQESSLLEVGEPAAEEQVTSLVEGEISTYTALRPVSIPARSSSMVPILQRRVQGQMFTLLDGGVMETCVRGLNSTGLVLQEGPSSFYNKGRFRGQMKMEREEPGDIGIWCYGHDPDVFFDQKSKWERKYSQFEWRDNTLWVHFIRTRTTDYTIENMAGQKRTVAVKIHHNNNGRYLGQGKRLTTDSENTTLLLVDVPARTEHVEQVVIEEGLAESVPLRLSRFDKLLDEPGLPGEQKQFLRDARRHVVAAESLRSKQEDNEKKIDKLRANVERFRRNLEIVPETIKQSKMVDRMLAGILTEEKSIQNLTDQIEELQSQILAKEEKTRQVLGRLAPKNTM